VTVRKTEAQLKKEAKKRAAKALRRTKERYGLGEPDNLKGVVVSPLHAGRTKAQSTIADRIPGSAPSSNLLHDHKWKRGSKETEATVTEIRRKAARIAPAYNKGALQYLPSGHREERRNSQPTLRSKCTSGSS
jgi:hypothetical protein